MALTHTLWPFLCNSSCLLSRQSCLLVIILCLFMLITLGKAFFYEFSFLGTARWVLCFPQFSILSCILKLHIADFKSPIVMLLKMRTISLSSFNFTVIRPVFLTNSITFTNQSWVYLLIRSFKGNTWTTRDENKGMPK